MDASGTEQAGLLPPEPHLSPQDMIRRAHDMIPQLRKRAEETETERKLLDKTAADFLDAGFFRIVQPRRFGGYEFDTEPMARTMVEVARGCSASGWTLCLTAGHTVLLAQYPEDVQAEAFGTDGDFRAPFQAFPGGEAIKADGGYVINGTWNYTSGCDHSNYFIGNILLPSDNGPPEVLAPLMPMADGTIIDNWDAMGMRGTGSKQVTFKDQFVPEAWAPATGALLQHGSATHSNPLYHGPFLPFFLTELASVAVGTAKGALDLFEETAASRILKNSRRTTAANDVTTRQKFAEATAICETAESALMECARRYMRLGAQHLSGEVERGHPDDKKLMLPLQQIIRMCAQVSDIVFMASGTSATLGNHPLQRSFRDMNMIRTHVLATMETHGEQWAALNFDVEPYYPIL